MGGKLIQRKELIYHRYLAFKFRMAANNIRGKGWIVKHCVARDILSYSTKLPKEHHIKFLEEMEKSGYIKVLDKQNILVLYELIE